MPKFKVISEYKPSGERPAGTASPGSCGDPVCF